MYNRTEEIIKKGKFTELCGTINIEVEESYMFVDVIERALVDDGFNVHKRVIQRGERGEHIKISLGVSRERNV